MTVVGPIEKNAATPPPGRWVKLLIVLTWIIVAGGQAVYRATSVDPIGASGHKCVMPDSIGRRPISRADERKANADLYANGIDPFDRIEKDGVCDGVSAQDILDLRLHPVATVLGSLFPALIFAPIVYWLSGPIIRRMNARIALQKARHKTCDFCAERIKSQARVCRFCGREVAV